jgi:hypothetical protein
MAATMVEMREVVMVEWLVEAKDYLLVDMWE